MLAERKATTPSLDLKRYNLFYEFNGSGKSTLSRILAALQHGKKQERLPEGCTFEIELSSGAKFTYPKALSGLEKCVCVFNGDFIAENRPMKPRASGGGTSASRSPIGYASAHPLAATNGIWTRSLS
nr:AAA family ATPase [Bradyrhizobium liaoningense]